MKEDLTLQQLIETVRGQAATKADYVADTRQLRYDPQTDSVIIDGHGDFGITEWAHRQLAEKLKIPVKYYDLMKADNPALLGQNINSWFETRPTTNLVRTLGGNMRAFLGRMYRPIDNIDLAAAILPELTGSPDITIASCSVTETRLYIKALFPKVRTDVLVGDTVQAGVCISNSEVGKGSLRVEPLIYRLRCTNGMIARDEGIRKFHIGGFHNAEDGASEYLRDETLAAQDKALFMKVQDTVRACMDIAAFETIVRRWGKSAEVPLHPVKAVEVIKVKAGLSDTEADSVLAHLLADNDATLYGLSNAITRTAQDAVSYDRATELEELGWNVAAVMPVSTFDAAALPAVSRN